MSERPSELTQSVDRAACMRVLPDSNLCRRTLTVPRFFILVINQLDAQNLFYNKFISSLYMFRAPCAHRQEVKIVLYSLWYHHIYRCDDTRGCIIQYTYRCDDTRGCIIQYNTPIGVMIPEAV